MEAKQSFPVMLLITIVKVVLGSESVVVFRILSPLFSFCLKSEGIFLFKFEKNISLFRISRLNTFPFPST